MEQKIDLAPWLKVLSDSLEFCGSMDRLRDQIDKPLTEKEKVTRELQQRQRDLIGLHQDGKCDGDNLIKALVLVKDQLERMRKGEEK